MDQRTSDADLKLNGYKLFRRDRVGDNHGGICVYVRENIYSCWRNDIELRNIVWVWAKMMVHNRKQLLGMFCRPPNSPHAVMTSIEDSIGLAFDTNIQKILITRNFNLDLLKDTSKRKIADVCQHFNLKQLINDPTNFTETSSSIVDLFF